MFHFVIDRIINDTMYTLNNLALAMEASDFGVSVICYNDDGED